MTKSLDEIDALVATEIMGWNLMGNEYFFTHNGQTTEYFRESKFALDLWQPTRRIEQAWEVMEKEILSNCNVSIDWNINYGVGNANGWCVTIDGSVMATFCETAPLAICMAVLRAKGIDV